MFIATGAKTISPQTFPDVLAQTPAPGNALVYMTPARTLFVLLGPAPDAAVVARLREKSATFPIALFSHQTTLVEYARFLTKARLFHLRAKTGDLEALNRVWKELQA